MQKWLYRFALFALVWTLVLFTGQPTVFAEELQGLDIKPDKGNVQVILDTNKSVSGVSVERTGRSSYDIIVPRTKLPQAFEETGIPTIHNAQTGVSASVQATPNGLRIHVSGTKKPVKVTFHTAPQPKTVHTVTQTNKVPSPKSPIALLKPGNQEIEGLFGQLKRTASSSSTTIASVPKSSVANTTQTRHVEKVAALNTRKNYSAASPHVHPKVIASSKQPITGSRHKSRPQASTLIAMAPEQKHVISPKQSVKAVTKPATVATHVAASAPVKVAMASSDKTVPQKPAKVEAPSDNERYRPPHRSVEQPSTVKTPATVPAPVKLPQPPATAVTTPLHANIPQTAPIPQKSNIMDSVLDALKGMLPQSVKGGLRSGGMINLAFIAIAALGAGILLLALLRLAFRRRGLSAQPAFTTQTALEEDATTDHYFEQPGPMSEPYETFEEALHQTDIEKHAQVMQQPASVAIEPTPQAQPIPAVLASATRPVLDNVLIHPANSIAAAVKSGLGSKASPYTPAPFNIISQAPNTQGGPARRPAGKTPAA